ncbi:TetR/AcrR family transcriptional regulator [Streptomyces mirabilis]|uniref:TetR/AcrR family transcriptional regulator n=1 Tax=Streptomyces mirabilis TaxID=68239 RepID=UPI0036872CBD
MTGVVRARRRRFTPEREAGVYGAVLDLLREVGYDALTMNAVAVQTRSSKATLYRRWGGKAELVAKAVRHYRPGPSLEDFDTGSLNGDLSALMLRTDDRAMEENAALMRGLATAVHANPDLREAFRDHVIEPEMAELHRILQRAIERGEVRADNPAIDLVMHVIIGGFVGRTFIDEQPPTRAFLLSYIDAVVLPALGVPTA